MQYPLFVGVYGTLVLHCLSDFNEKQEQSKLRMLRKQKKGYRTLVVI
jgi:hypothetical protein